MFRPMRRKAQQLSADEAGAILCRGSSGVLAVSGDDGYPYAVPLSYVYLDGKLYFHCARAGHKLDAVRRCPKASFCVIDQDRVVAEEYTTYFRSAIAFGQVGEVTDESRKRQAIVALAEKYAPLESADHRDKAIAREWDAMCLLEMTIDHLTGKQAAELCRQAKTE